MPPGVRPDTLDGVTYVGLIPFRMVGAGIGGGPGVPWLGSFLETNVRLYSVDDTGRRGIVFLSLDADRAAVVVGARRRSGSPTAGRGCATRPSATSTRMTRGCVIAGDRREATWWSVSGQPVSRPSSTTSSAPAGDCTCTGGAARSTCPNRHEAWPLHDAEVVALDDDLMASAGLPGLASRPPDHVAFSPGVRTVFGFPGDATRPRRP